MDLEPSENDARRLLQDLQCRLSDRKLRLFSLACIRRFDSFLDHPTLENTRMAIGVLDRHLDGFAGLEELVAARAGALAEIEQNVSERALENWTGSDMAHVLLANDPVKSAARHIDLTQDFAYDVVTDNLPENLTDDEAWEMVTGPVRAQLCAWLRDLDAAATIRPKWKTPEAIAIADEMYARRDFTAMPVLAEALRYAGCKDEAVLDHCRRPCEHIRGCWVVDGVLGKS